MSVPFSRNYLLRQVTSPFTSGLFAVAIVNEISDLVTKLGPFIFYVSKIK